MATVLGAVLGGGRIDRHAADGIAYGRSAGMVMVGMFFHGT